MMVFRSSSIRVGLAFGIFFFALIFLAPASVSVEAKSRDTTTDLDFELANELELMESMDVDELIAHTESLKSHHHSLAYPPSVPPDFNWHTQNRSLGMCAMYGTCPGDPLNRVVNCPYNVPAVMPDFNVTLCPHLLGGPVCCDINQYHNLTARVGQAAAILDRCPACYQSFLEFFCELTCSPNQANFMTVENVWVVHEDIDPGTGKVIDQTLVVNETMFYTATPYAERFYNSCRDVKSAATGNPVMTFIFNAYNYKEFLDFLGQPGTTQDKSPILIRYTYTEEDNNQTMNLVQRMRDCNDSDSTYTCSCVDCRWCNGPQCTPHLPQPDAQLVLGGSFVDPLNGGLLLGALAYLAVLAIWWAIHAMQRQTPSALTQGVPRSTIRSIQCGRQAAIPLIVLSVLFIIFFIVGVVWITSFGHSHIPNEAETDHTISFLDSYWEYPLFGVMIGCFTLLLFILLLASICTIGLGNFSWRHLERQRRERTISSDGLTGDLDEEDGVGVQSSYDSGDGSHRVTDVTKASEAGRDSETDEDEDEDEDDFDDDDEESIAASSTDRNRRGIGLGPVRRRKSRSISDRIFTQIGHFVATYPWFVIELAILGTALCAIGITHLELETDPIKLWVPPDSQINLDKDRFDSTFGPFYRTQQVIFFMDTSHYNPALFPNMTLSLLEPQMLRQIYSIEKRIQSLTAVYDGANVTWGDLCNRPTSQGCIRQSVTGYFDNAQYQNKFINPAATLDVIREWVGLCVNEPAYSACRSDVGAPMFPKVVFGGFDFEAEDYVNATALITTWLLNNEPVNQSKSEAWEQLFLDTVVEIQQECIERGIPLKMHYSAERSVQDELTRSSEADIPTIAISYAVMFIYISLALGRLYPFDRYFFTRTKCMVGFSAILLVLFSLTISVGLVCTMGVKMTPIISEVIPFLVLAIGIDNVFILLNTFQRQSRVKYPSIRVRMKRTLREVGTSITLASLSEAVAFILGGQTKMPAVRAFAFYSCAAILADYVLQITAFSAVIVLDARRTESGRMDCCPCVRIRKDGVKNNSLTGGDYSERLLQSDPLTGDRKSRKSSQPDDFYEYHATTGEVTSPVNIAISPLTTPSSIASPSNVLSPPSRSVPSVVKSSSRRVDGDDGIHPIAEPNIPGRARGMTLEDHSEARYRNTNDGLLERFMRRYYVPFLLHRVTKMIVLIVFVLTFFFMIGYGLHNLELGLDHKYVVPEDSYLQDYFHDLQAVFAVGPPVYFVINPSNLTDFKEPVNQNRICSQSGCSPTSVQALIFNEICDPSAYLAQGPSSWLDDYITWLKIRAPCCRLFTRPYGKKYKKGDLCPASMPDSICQICLQPEDFITYNNVTRPPPEAFTKYLEMYLTKSECSTSCGTCGWGHNADVIWDPVVNRTQATRYMAYHSPLRSETEFINALKSGRRINQKIIDEQHLDAYVYSVVYPFFEQYLYIVDVCVLNTGLGMAGIFVLCLILIRNLWASLAIVLTICMILGDMLGVMAMWSVTLNALSVLNFVMAIGVSVEFCIHLTVAFMANTGPRDLRVANSLVTVGSSIVAGITLTKFSGVVVLAAATSQVFQIYYFRMYFTLVILATFHGLMLLPVILSLIGPPSVRRSSGSGSTKRSMLVSFFAAVDENGMDRDEWSGEERQKFINQTKPITNTTSTATATTTTTTTTVAHFRATAKVSASPSYHLGDDDQDDNEVILPRHARSLTQPSPY